MRVYLEVPPEVPPPPGNNCVGPFPPATVVVHGNFHLDADVDWFSAVANESQACNAPFRFQAFIDSVPNGSIYEVSLYHRLRSDLNGPFIGPIGAAMAAQLDWDDTDGVDDARDLLIEVRRIIGPATNEPYTIRLQWR